MASLSQIPCVILAGGLSSRMGQDKAFLPYHHQSLISYQVQKFSQIFGTLYVSAKSDKFGGTYKLILDESEIFTGQSPMLALYSVLHHFQGGFVFVVAVDFARIEASHIQILYEKLDNSCEMIIPQTPSHKHFLCGFYSISLQGICKDLLHKNIHKIGLLSKYCKACFVEFDDKKAFFNCNTPADYALLKEVK